MTERGGPLGFGILGGSGSGEGEFTVEEEDDANALEGSASELVDHTTHLQTAMGEGDLKGAKETVDTILFVVRNMLEEAQSLHASLSRRA